MHDVGLGEVDRDVAVGMGGAITLEFERRAVELEIVLVGEDLGRNPAGRLEVRNCSPSPRPAAPRERYLRVFSWAMIFAPTEFSPRVSSVWSKCQCVLMSVVIGSELRSASALVNCGRDTRMPASTSTLPSGPVRTAMFPPEPSSALMLLRSLCTAIGEVAALSLIRLTRPRASAKACRGLSPVVAAKPPEARQQRQKARLDRPEECALVIRFPIPRGAHRLSDRRSCPTLPGFSRYPGSSGNELAIEEIPDQGDHHIGLVLKREMPGVDEMQFGVRQVLKIGRRAVGGEDLVVLAPDDQRRRLALAKERLEFRIERDVGSIVEEEVELDVLVSGAIEQRLIVAPIVRIDAGNVGHAVDILELRRFRRDEEGERGAMRFGSVGPISLDRVPESLEPFLIGVAVLHDQCGHPIGMLERQPVSDRRAVIHEVDCVGADAKLRQKTVDDVGVMGERVGERLVVGRGAFAKSWIVGRNDVVAIRERRDQIAEHVRRGRKAVQQQHDLRILRPRFAIEDVDPVDLGRAVMNNWNGGLMRCARRGRVGGIEV